MPVWAATLPPGIDRSRGPRPLPLSTVAVADRRLQRSDPDWLSRPQIRDSKFEIDQLRPSKS